MLSFSLGCSSFLVFNLPSICDYCLVNRRLAQVFPGFPASTPCYRRLFLKHGLCRRDYGHGSWTRGAITAAAAPRYNSKQHKLLTACCLLRFRSTTMMEEISIRFASIHPQWIQSRSQEHWCKCTHAQTHSQTDFFGKFEETCAIPAAPTYSTRH